MRCRRNGETESPSRHLLTPRLGTPPIVSTGANSSREGGHSAAWPPSHRGATLRSPISVVADRRSQQNVAGSRWQPRKKIRRSARLHRSCRSRCGGAYLADLARPMGRAAGLNRSRMHRLAHAQRDNSTILVMAATTPAAQRTSPVREALGGSLLVPKSSEEGDDRSVKRGRSLSWLGKSLVT